MMKMRALNLRANLIYGTPIYRFLNNGTLIYKTSIYGTPIYGAPIYGIPIYGSPIYRTPIYGTPIFMTVLRFILEKSINRILFRDT